MSDEKGEKQTERCGTMDYHQYLLKVDPAYEKNRLEVEKFTQEFIKNYHEGGEILRTGVVQIPVVVHVVYKNETENITNAQINSQIDVLNRDFSLTNTDFGSINGAGAYHMRAADTRIQFRLAVRDPGCNVTTGITRTPTNISGFFPPLRYDASGRPIDPEPIKFTSMGGHDAWPRDRYLNIWVCDLKGRNDNGTENENPLGYAQFPGGPADRDGVVIDYTCMGTTGTAGTGGHAAFNLGRTATHEIGHWLNLLHIWGDDFDPRDPSNPRGCNQSDNIVDTPNQRGPTTSCPGSFPTTVEACSDTGTNGPMYMNYMDYTDDRCMYMFTIGQVSRITATINGSRSSLLASDGLIPVSASAPDLWSQDTPIDDGREPDTLSPYFYLSDDIWIRPDINDGRTMQDHSDPVYHSNGNPNYVYVRIRNRGCNDAPTANVKLYWAKASTGLGWPQPWDGTVTIPAPMGGSIGTLSTGTVVGHGQVILEFPWRVPNPRDYAVFGGDRSHFCLLARIETSANPPYGMHTPEGPNLNTNVMNNNNIVWKNVTIANSNSSSSGGRIGSVTVNIVPVEKRETSIIKLVFTSPSRDKVSTIFKRGIVRVNLGKVLYDKWKKGNSVGYGIREDTENSLIISENNAWIGNILLKSSDFHTIDFLFEPHANVQETNSIFYLDVTQYELKEVGDKEGYIVGGQRFILRYLPKIKLEEGKEKLVFDGARWVEK